MLSREVIWQASNSPLYKEFHDQGTNKRHTVIAWRKIDCLIFNNDSSRMTFKVRTLFSVVGKYTFQSQDNFDNFLVAAGNK